MSTNPGRPRFFEEPVRWLLGRQLIGALKGAILYATFGKKLDPRDWMTGEEVSFADDQAIEFWFDYISDVGDGTRAMYSSAYLLMCKSLGTKLSPATTKLPGVQASCEVTTRQDAQEEFPYQLPRGEFLFLGGDTAYHTAEYMTLVNRIQHPFKYAYEDLDQKGLVSHERHPIFGIPGNHDYYDQLDGFRRQLRKPVRPEGPLPPGRSGPENAQLTIAGFERVQEASYVALRLPFGWWFWGLDTEPGPIDLRQRKFFLTREPNPSVSEWALPVRPTSYQSPEKLIIATCSPSTVCGHLASKDDFKAGGSIDFMGVDVPFIPDPDANGKPDLAQSGDAKLKKGQCRLDLSGDVHHYARYWGPASGSKTREHNSAPVPAAESYASIVSGAGGAFHHPSTTYDNEICEQALYPSETESREAVGNRIVNFWNVMNGGYVWVAGLIISFMIFFGAVVPTSGRQFLSNIEILNRLHLVKREPIQPTVIHPNADPCQSVEPFGLWVGLGITSATWQPPAGCTPASPKYFFGSELPWPADLTIGMWLIIGAFLAIVVTLVFGAFTTKIFTDENLYRKPKDPARILWPVVIGITILIIPGLFSVEPYRDHITPFVSSIMVLFCFLAAIVAIVLANRYNGYLFKKSFVASLSKSDQLLPWVLWGLAVLIAVYGLWFFGKNNLPAFLVSDILFVATILTLAFCVIVLPFKVGGDLLYTKPQWVQILGKSVIALWHLILQLLVPFVLIKRGNYLTWLLAVILLFLPIPLARLLMRKDSRFGVALMWLAYGTVMLALPWITTMIQGPYEPVFSNTVGWMGLWPSLLAGVAGLVICCLWTAWYFTVCHAFNGHNNEVGGAARIEGFKQFIRFKLTREGLTGYVIAVDDVSKIGEPDGAGKMTDGSVLKPRIVDVFQLKPKT